MKEARVHNYRKGYENAGDTVARATMGCDNAGDTVAEATMGCGNAGDTVARATMGCGNAGDTVARATMGCGNAGRHSAEASGYMERSLCQTTGGQMGRPDIEQFSNYGQRPITILII